MDEGNALGLGSEEIIIAVGIQQLQHCLGAGHGQLGIAKADESADVQILCHLADGQLTVQTGHCQGICMHKNSPFAPKSPDIRKALPNGDRLVSGTLSHEAIFIECAGRKQLFHNYYIGES